MNKGIRRVIMVLAALAGVSGCATSNVHKQPVLSAADAAVIKVEIRELEPLPIDDAVAALAD